MARNYYKRNFVDAVEILTPDLYLEDDLEVSGVQVKDIDELINSHIYSAEKVYATLALSSIVGSNLFSSLGNINGFSQFFLKNNKQTEVTTQAFQDTILTPMGARYSDYSTSTTFANYLSGTLLPKLTLNSATLQADTSALFGATVDETTKYLLHHMGWLYLLNTGGPVYSASSIITSSIIETLYNKNSSYKTNNGVKDYQEYLWRNYSSFSAVDSRIIPERFTSGVGTYTSGNENLNKLKTLVDVAYSPLNIDKDDTLVETAFKNYISTSAVLTNTESAGPFSKFLKGMAYSMYDVNDQVEGIEDLLSVDDCPVGYLPHLANLVGWKLYGKNEQSWRNQIRNAASLYRKKGTKQGLIDAFNSIITQNPINTEESLTELYESYVPNLLFYALVTESPLFKTSKTYTAQDAESVGADFILGDLDFNVKAAVDTIIQNVVVEFPDNFVLKNEPFRVNRISNGKAWFGPVVVVEGAPGSPSSTVTAQYVDGELVQTNPAYVVETLADPAFVFNYRGKDHPLPPWDEEKFYANTTVTVDLLNFLKVELEKFCVPVSMRSTLAEYVYSYTVSGHQNTDLYIDNRFLFFTSSHQFAPNTEQILGSYDEKDYNYLSLWNGKSSTFDFSVSGGLFTSEVFGDVSAVHTVNEILQSLSIVHEMSPAKAIPKVKFSKASGESASGADKICPSVRVPFQEVQATGILANLEACGVWDRATGHALGRQVYPSYDDSDSVVSHAELPVFSRDQAQYGFSVSQSVVNTSATVLATSAIDRRTIRRRDFQLALQKSGWFDRAGKNMPSFYNNTGSILEFVPLGYDASTGGYAPATPENLSGVYGLLDCSTTTSNKNFFGVDVSNTFNARANDTLAFSSCDQFVRRDTLPEAAALFWELEEKKKYAIATEILKHNDLELNATANRWRNLVAEFADQISDTGYRKYYSPKLDIRNLTDEPHGVHYIYKVFNQYFSGNTFNYDSLPENFVNKYKNGGPNILSHVYGPLYENADFTTDGSAVDVSAQLISNSILAPYPINIGLSGTDLSTVGVKVDSNNLTFLKDAQFSTKDIVSGISFVDTSTSLTPTNEFIVLDLAKEGLYRSDARYLLNRRNILLRSRSHGLPRLRFGLRATDKPNILIPEHDFELTLKYLTGDDKVNELGSTSIGVMIHTKVETTVSGKSVMFVWTKNQEWEMVYIEDLQKEYSRDLIIQKYSHLFSDSKVSIPPGTAGSCGEEGESVQILDSITSGSYSEAKVQFNTSNKPLPAFDYGTYYNASFPDVYNGQRNQIHRANLSSGIRNQNYFLEVFALPTDAASSKFVLLDEINVVDKTLNDAAKIPYEACIPDLGGIKNTVELATPYNTKGEEIKAFPLENVLAQSFLDPGGVWESELMQPSKDRTIGVTTNPTGLLGDTQFSPGHDAGGWGQWGWGVNLYFEGVEGGSTYGANILEDAVQSRGLVLRKGGGSVGSQLGITLPRFNWFKARPLPYTACHFDSWTGTKWGWTSFENAENGLGMLTKYQSMNIGMYGNPFGLSQRQFMGVYFKDRGGLYPNTDETSVHFGKNVGSWASFNKWSDLCFNGQIPQTQDQSVVPSWDIGNPGSPYHLYAGQGAGGGYYGPNGIPTEPPSGITNPQGPDQPLRAMGPGTSMSMKDFHSFFLTGHDIKNPIGYTLRDDDLGNWPVFNQDERNVYGAGAPTMLCFLSRRYAPWGSTVFQEDPYKSEIVSNLAALPSIFGIGSAINRGSRLKSNWEVTMPWPTTPGGNDFANYGNFSLGTLGVEENYNPVRALPPRAATYYDIHADDLVGGQDYTFTIYVAKPPFSQQTQKNWGYPNGSHGQPTTMAGVWGQNGAAACTSATVNICPIDVATSFSRIVIDLDTGDYDATSLGNGSDGTVEVIEYTTPDPVTWYKVQVTLQYNHTEEDMWYGGGETPLFTEGPQPPGYNGPTVKPNYGLRAFVQGINTRADGTINPPEDDKAPIDIPGVMMVWGSTITKNKNVQWERSSTQWGLCSSSIEYELPPDCFMNLCYKMNPETTQIIYTAYTVTDPFWIPGSEFPVKTERVLNVDGNGEITYTNPNTSSLDKVTLSVPADGSYSQRNYTSSLLYDTSGKLVRNTQIVVDSTERLMLFDKSTQHYPETYQNVLEARHDNILQPTNVNYCIAGSIPLIPKELLHLFRYFNYIGQTTKGSGLNTRVANVDSTGVHCASGGSRLSYRTHPDNFSIGTSGVTFHNFTDIDITN